MFWTGFLISIIFQQSRIGFREKLKEELRLIAKVVRAISPA